MASISLACFLVVTLQLSGIIGARSKFQVPPNCVNKTICFDEIKNYQNYPQNEIDEILRNRPDLRNSKYDEDEVAKLKHERVDDINCSTQVEVGRIFAVKGENGRFYPVAQSKFLTQRIRHVICAGESKQCMGSILAQPNRYKATCETEKGKIDLYVYDEVTNEVILMPTKVDSCCKCVIRDVTRE